MASPSDEFLGSFLDGPDTPDAERLAELQRAVLSTVPHGLVVWDAANRDQATMDAGFVALLGGSATPTDIASPVLGWRDVIVADDLPRMLDVLDRHALAADAVLENDVRYHHRDGSQRWLRCRSVEVPGAPDRVLGVHADVTADHERDDELADARRRLTDRSTELQRVTARLTELGRHMDHLVSTIEATPDSPAGAADAAGPLRVSAEQVRAVLAEIRPADEPAGLAVPEVMVVDDDLDALTLVQQTIEQCGARLVATARSAAEAIEAYLGLERPPALVLIDHQLGSGGRGLDVARSVLTLRPGQDVVLRTAHIDAEVVDAGRALGVRRTVAKGSVADLADLIREFVEPHQSGD